MKKNPAAPHRSNFIDAFSAYLRQESPGDQEIREEMLDAFGRFLAGEGIGLRTKRHGVLIAKMTAFAGPVRGGGPGPGI